MSQTWEKALAEAEMNNYAGISVRMAAALGSYAKIEGQRGMNES